MRKDKKIIALVFVGFVTSSLLIIAPIISVTLGTLAAPSLVSMPFFALASVAYMLGIIGMHFAYRMWKVVKNMPGTSQDSSAVPTAADALAATAALAPTDAAADASAFPVCSDSTGLHNAR